MAEHQIQFRLPCWLISVPNADGTGQTSQLVIQQQGGKHILQIFLEKEEAERFLVQANLTDKVLLAIGSAEHLVSVTEQLHQNGVAEVHIFFKAENESRRADLPISDFNAELRKQVGRG